jgi:hypothetical protein
MSKGQGAMPKDKTIAEAIYRHLRKDPPKPEEAEAAGGVYLPTLRGFGLLPKED